LNDLNRYLLYFPEENPKQLDEDEFIGTEVPLCYPDFNKPLHLYDDSSDHQLGAVIMQDKKPISFYSQKLSTAQKRYTTNSIEAKLSSLLKPASYTRTSC
jgi:hypothetical protein